MLGVVRILKSSGPHSSTGWEGHESFTWGKSVHAILQTTFTNAYGLVDNSHCPCGYFRVLKHFYLTSLWGAGGDNAGVSILAWTSRRGPGEDPLASS